MWLSSLVLITSLVLGNAVDDPVVSTKYGKVRGLTSKTSHNKMTFYAFLGIPYAKPPIGNLRFQPPQPASNWNRILETKVFNKQCFQTDVHGSDETEDCLYLSVVTPSLNAAAKLPVMINIHAGAFVHGHGIFSQYQPQSIIEKGIIVVSLNYRLGQFGFLSTGDLVVPGNMGLKDQQLAIKWVNENIVYFGGDPQKVTIEGASAGGASVSFQLLNPRNQGLFRAAISSSGSALCSWAYQRHSVDQAYAIAQMINPKITRNTTTRDLLTFLQSVNASAIDRTGNKYGQWSPVIEREHAGAFLTKSMYEILQKGENVKVPLIMGMNSEECLFKVKDLNAFKISISKYDKAPSALVSEEMGISNSQIILKTAKDIKSIYTNNTWENSPAGGVQYTSDDQFMRAIIKNAELQSAHSDVYFYQFSYHGEIGQNNIVVPGLGYRGVTHGEDQTYLWGQYNPKYSKSDLLTIERYISLFTNFVKTLNPTPVVSELFQNITWPKVNPKNFRYLNIDSNLQIALNPRKFSYSKWVNIWEAVAGKPFITF